METKNSKDDLEIDLGEVISVVLSRIWIVIFIGILGALSMMIISKFLIAPVYSTTTQVYVLNRQDQSSTNLTSADLQSGSQLSKDYVEIITSRTVLEQVISELGLEDIDAAGLKSMVSVSAPTDTRSIYITVNDTDAYRAQQIANKIREVASFKICEIMQVEAVNVVDEANIPASPSSPNIIKNTILGGVAGIVLAIAIIVIGFLMDDTIKTSDDVERYLGLSVLGSIPVLEDSKKAKKQKNYADMALEDEPVYYEDSEEEELDAYEDNYEDDYDYSDYSDEDDE